MLRIERSGDGRGARLVTTAPYQQGQLIARISGGTVRRMPTVHSVQTGPDTHLDGFGDLVYLNHSCRPNVIVNTATLTVTAARDIAAGDELTYFYPSTEWELHQPFVCLCGAPECIGYVAGAKHLPPEVLARYFMNEHILRMVKAEREDDQSA